MSCTRSLFLASVKPEEASVSSSNHFPRCSFVDHFRCPLLIRRVPRGPPHTDEPEPPPRAGDLRTDLLGAHQSRPCGKNLPDYVGESGLASHTHHCHRC